MNKYDDYMKDAFQMLDAGTDCGECVALHETVDCFGTGDSPTCYECFESDYARCPRTDDMEELALEEIGGVLIELGDNYSMLEWLLKAMKENTPEEMGYRLLEEL